MKNSVKPVKKRRSIAVINIYVLILSFVPFFIGIGSSIYLSDTKSHLSELINISGSQRMRTMLLSNYAQRLHNATLVSNQNIKKIKNTIQTELTKYEYITHILLSEKSGVKLKKSPALTQTIIEVNDLVNSYVANCNKLLNNPSDLKSLILITSKAMQIKDKFDVLTNAYQSYNDKIIANQKVIDTSMLTIALIVTIYGLFMTRRIFYQEKELIKAKEKAEKLATQDHLTQLPNRRLLMDRFKQNQLLAKRNNMKMALCVIDLDDFKSINDNLGHYIGDEVLKEAARRISKILREYDTVSRVGGDEFVLMLINITDRDDCNFILNRILDEIRKPVIINSFTLNLTLSIGYAMYTDDGSCFQELYEKADTALYEAKRNGKNRYQNYIRKKI